VPTLLASFTQSERIRKREAYPATNETDLDDFANRYQLPPDRLKKLNPELKGKPLHGGNVVWLVARIPLPVGAAKTVEEFCEIVLGDKFLWSTIWSYNPNNKDGLLKPGDTLWVVPDDVRQSVASSAPTGADVQTSLQSGNAFVDFAAGRVRVRLDDTNKAAAFTAWKVAQSYGPTPLTVVQVNARLAGDFGRQVIGTWVQFLALDYPEFSVKDAIFASDPRYLAHIIRRP
jgi:hypothetical protein